MNFTPSFSLNLEQPIFQSQAVIGKCKNTLNSLFLITITNFFIFTFTLCIVDGKHPSLACATSGGKILVHSPHEPQDPETQSHIRHLNFNKKITALCSGTTHRYYITHTQLNY